LGTITQQLKNIQKYNLNFQRNSATLLRKRWLERAVRQAARLIGAGRFDWHRICIA